MLGWGLAVGVWLAAAPAGAEDKRREPQRCEERCDDEAQRCREICKKFAGDNDACFKACSDEEKRCTQQCKESARR
jgi:hypothetical protein